jgi:hypothetical protein
VIRGVIIVIQTAVSRTFLTCNRSPASPAAAHAPRAATRVPRRRASLSTQRVAGCRCAKAAGPLTSMTSGASPTNSAAYVRYRSSSPAPQRVSIRGCGRWSSPILQPLRERQERGLSFRIVRSLTHEHADTPHPLACCARVASGHAALASRFPNRVIRVRSIRSGRLGIVRFTPIGSNVRRRMKHVMRAALKPLLGAMRYFPRARRRGLKVRATSRA